MDLTGKVTTKLGQMTSLRKLYASSTIHYSGS